MSRPYYELYDGPRLGPRGLIVFRARLWHSKASHDTDEPPLPDKDDRFQFARNQATHEIVALDPVTGRRLLDDGSVADKYTRTQALAVADRAFALLKALTEATLPGSAARTEYEKKRQALADEWVKEDYLPEGRSWKLVQVPTFGQADVERVLLARYRALVDRGAAAQAILANLQVAVEGEL